MSNISGSNCWLKVVQTGSTLVNTSENWLNLSNWSNMTKTGWNRLKLTETGKMDNTGLRL